MALCEKCRCEFDKETGKSLYLCDRCAEVEQVVVSPEEVKSLLEIDPEHDRGCAH